VCIKTVLSKANGFIFITSPQESIQCNENTGNRQRKMGLCKYSNGQCFKVQKIEKVDNGETEIEAEKRPRDKAELTKDRKKEKEKRESMKGREK